MQCVCFSVCEYVQSVQQTSCSLRLLNLYRWWTHLGTGSHIKTLTEGEAELASLCMSGGVCVSVCVWLACLQTLPDILSLDASSGTVGTWTADGGKKKEKTKSGNKSVRSYIMFFKLCQTRCSLTFSGSQVSVILTLGQGAGWRRGVGLWTAWFGCCGRRSKPFLWPCFWSPIQEAEDPAPHSSHYSDLCEFNTNQPLRHSSLNKPHSLKSIRNFCLYSSLTRTNEN